jgi:alpha-1,3-rhamnosyl/mannosyltransferase
MEPSTPIRVGFDVSSAAGRRPRGIAGYIRALLPALERAAPWIEPVLFLRDERWFRRSSLSDLLPGAKRRWIFEPIKAPLAGLDVFHGMGTRLPKSSRVPRSFTLHDLRGFDLEGASPPSNKPTRIGRRERTVRQADRILCISEHGKARLLHHFPDLDPMTIEVIHHAVDHERFHPRDESERRTALSRLGINAPFFLQLGSFFPHKNLELALEGFARSRASREGYQLMFVGGGGSDSHRARLRELVDALGLSGSVAWVDDISATALPVILSAARGLLMPSRYEGFGLPILEAMASGVPGVCSDATCLPEIAGGVWDTCDPDDADAFAASIDLLAFDDEEHAKRGTDGITRAGLFTWDSCAERTAAFLGRVAESARSS